MKICPTCQQKYSDSLEYCMQDGTVLTALPDPNATLKFEARPTQSTSRVSKQGFTFGAIAVASVALIAVVIFAGAIFMYLGRNRDAAASNRSGDPSLANNGNTVTTPTKESIAKDLDKLNDEI